MKRNLLILLGLFFSLSLYAQGQNLTDSLKTDTIKLHQGLIIIKYPANFRKKESPIEHGGRFITYMSQPRPISLITIMEADNSLFDFGKNCVIIDKTESEHCYTEKGFCPLKGYYRSNIYKKTRITIAYENVSECELSLFDYILGSAIVKRQLCLP
jgi:hypothetical protein